MSAKKKVLITGATGFLGKKLIPNLLKDYKVICFVRKNSNIDGLKKTSMEFRYGDILNKESLINATKNVDIVIHLATSHNTGNEDFNFIGSKNLIDACYKNKIKRVIFISSMASKRKVLDSYGKTKLKIEKMFEESKLDYTIFRPSIIYSEDNLSLIGQSLRQVPFIIPIIGNGNYKINPVYINDVVDSIIQSLKNKKSIKKTYDVSGGKSFSFNEIINICKEKFGIKKMTVHIPIFLCLIIFRFVPILSIESIKGINEDTNADISELKKDLKVYPISFNKGIKKNVNL